MRGVYIATIPLLAVILLGLLILAPRAPGAPSRGKVALATVLALGGAALLMWGIEIWAQSLNVGTLSPRPFMTRWVNLLIVEPQDNSFPCVEVMVATISRRRNLGGASLVGRFRRARHVYCSWSRACFAARIISPMSAWLLLLASGYAVFARAVSRAAH